MTAMAAGLALIPLAFGGGKAGSEIQTPMAIVILCGLMTSTLLNMVVVPTMYLRYARPAPMRAESMHNWRDDPLLERFSTLDNRLASKVLYTYPF
jgi:hypothetical protein